MLESTIQNEQVFERIKKCQIYLLEENMWVRNNILILEREMSKPAKAFSITMLIIFERVFNIFRHFHV